MDDDIVRGFAALAAPSRLRIVQLLATAPAEGIPSGEIAEALDVAQNTMSSQLMILASARVVKARRDGRSIFYTVDREGLRALARFLSEQRAPSKATKATMKRRQSSKRRAASWR